MAESKRPGAGRTRHAVISAAITVVAWLAFYAVSGSGWVALGLVALLWTIVGISGVMDRLRGGRRG